ncbi:hypothetical protein DSL72_006765 [Monilinia vaccinii-corymbosi]|uniref:Rhodopsin domain-containing protein n=1 Tax=Monilinia vaccinii-corymbosi TaxID=61207 RepID=A0A8A3PN25_9HELO|nr:hypothetical protein DSL72_006765 [Monilinia vaccinii-corymbosi]
MSTTIDSFHPRSNAVFVVTTITFIITSTFVVARLVSRFAILKLRTWDDWSMIIAWTFAFGLTISIDYATTKGLGRLDKDIKDEWRSDLKKAEYAFTFLYNPCLMATKNSMLIFYLRLSKDTQSFLRRASYITLAVVNFNAIVLTFLNVFQCNPINAAWREDIHGSCLSILTLYLASAPVNIITDLAILVLPIPVLTGMILPQKQKAILVLTFSLGVFVTIVDVVRIYYLQQASNEFQIPTSVYLRLGDGENFAYNASLAFMWSAVEVNVGIVCACIPTLKPLIKRILPAMIMDRGTAAAAAAVAAARSSHTHSMDKFGSICSQGGARGRGSTFDLAPPQACPASASPISPLSNAHPGGHREDVEEERFNAVNLLPASRAVGSPPLRKKSTARTPSSTYFGLVSMRVPKNMMKLRGGEAFKYCAVVTTLFCLWGFSYGLLNKLNREIAILANYTETQTVGLSSSYFASYAGGALTAGQLVLRHSGFKATFITGLCIFGTGTLMFWPSAVLTSYTGFIISSCVLGFGLSILETAANPFILLCGPTQYAEFRLMLAQSVQAITSLVSQVLADKVFFSDARIDGKKHLTLIDVQWTYLAITLFTVILALFFYYMPLPEANDADLQEHSELREIYPTRKLPWTGTSIVYTTLAFGVVAQLCYVAAQECLFEFFKPLLLSRVPNVASFQASFGLDEEDYHLLGRGVYTIGRFVCAPLCLLIQPRILLLVAFSGVVLFSGFIFSLDNISYGFLGAASLIACFFEGPIFPLIFSMSIRGMGKHTKWASACLVASASGGSVFVFVAFGVQKLHTVQYSFVVVFVVSLVGLLFPIYLNFGGVGVRHQVNPRAGRMGGGVWSRSGDGDGDGEAGLHGGGGADPRRTPLGRWGRKVSILVQKMSFSGRKCSAEMPVIEHRELRDRGGSEGGARDEVIGLGKD